MICAYSWWKPLTSQHLKFQVTPGVLVSSLFQKYLITVVIIPMMGRKWSGSPPTSKLAFVELIGFCFLVWQISHCCGWSATEWLLHSLLWNNTFSKEILNPHVHILTCNSFTFFSLLVNTCLQFFIWKNVVLSVEWACAKNTSVWNLPSQLDEEFLVIAAKLIVVDILATAPCLTTNKNCQLIFPIFHWNHQTLQNWHMVGNHGALHGKQTNSQKWMLMNSWSHLVQHTNNFSPFFPPVSTEYCIVSSVIWSLTRW